MARTAPIPNIPAIPGMCPGVAVLGGGGAGGGSGGKGAGAGAGGAGAEGGGGTDGTAPDGRSAGSPDSKKYPHCGTRSCPVDVITGRVFTLEQSDLELSGPLPLRFFRVYSSAMRQRDVGLGFGWAHSLGWEIEVRRRDIRVWNDQGAFLAFDPLDEGATQQGRFGWLLQRHEHGYMLDTDEGLSRYFEQAADKGKRWRLSRMVDRNGNTIALKYNEAGHLVEIIDSAGRVIRTPPDKHGRITRLQVRNAITRGRWVAMVEYAYDDDGHLLSATDADGFTNRYAYTPEHRLIKNGYKCGIVFHFTYDERGRCIESWGAYPGKRDRSIYVKNAPTTLADGKTLIKGVHHCRYDYHPDGYTEVHDSTRTTRYQGNALGLLDKTVIGAGVSTVEYRHDGFVMAESDELGHTTSYQRDDRGRVTSVTNPLGHTTVYERDARGLLTAVIDPEGQATHIERDGCGNLLCITWPDGGTEARRYDERGLLTEITEANGAHIAINYDEHGNVTEIAQPNDGRWRYRYDAFGRRLSEIDPTGATTTYSYSTRGDLLATHDAAGGVARYSYDGDRQLRELVSPQGAITKLVWAGLHKLIARIDANGNAVQLRYNHEGELLRVFNEAGEHHVLHRDSSGTLVGETTFDGRELRYQRDLAGRITRVENGASELTDLRYDAAGRLVGRELHDGTEEAFTYNNRDELIGASNATGMFRFERDPVGRIVRESQRVAGTEHWIEVRYDGDGERIKRRTSLGHSEHIERNELGARTCTQLGGDHRIHHTTDVLGREAARVLIGGGRIRTHYDPLGRLSKRLTSSLEGRRGAEVSEPDWLGTVVPSGGAVARYRYDLDGELTSVHDSLCGRTDYSYDPVGQLLGMVPEQARRELFRYDTRGNLEEAHDDAPSRVYGAGNRLERKGETRFLWDDDGRLVEKRAPAASGASTDEVWRYSWNGAGLLAQVERPDRTVVRFAYDPFARRVSKTLLEPANNGVLQPTSHTRFVWDGNVLAHEIRTSAAGAGDPIIEQRTYLFEDGSFVPLAHQQDGRWLHYVNDPIGTPERLVDDNGEIVCEMRRTAWGRVEVQHGSSATTPLRFQGQYADDETALRCNLFRYYDSALGSFISSDPIGLYGGVHAFQYGPNALTWIDPLGLAGSRGHSADWELRGSDGRIKTRGKMHSGSVAPPGRRLTFSEQLDVHTEPKIMKKVKPQVKAGDILTIRGTKPPCNPGGRGCQKAMQEFATENNATVKYSAKGMPEPWVFKP